MSNRHKDRTAAALDLLRRHFPQVLESRLYVDAELVAVGMYRGPGPAVEKQKSLADVEKARQLAIELRKVFDQLPVGSKGLGKLQQRLQSVVYDLTGEAGPFASRLKQADGTPLFPAKTGVLDLIRGDINDFENLSAKQREHEYNPKVLLISHAREVWRRNKAQLPPAYAKEGNAFYAFVQDLIDFYGKDWTARAALDAWRKSEAQD